MSEKSGYAFITNLAVDGEELVIYRRLGGVSASDRIKIRPFLLSGVFDVPGAETVTHLSGDQGCCFKAEFPSCTAYEEAAAEIKHLDAVRTFRDYIQMAFLDTEIRLYKSMEFSDLVRMQVALDFDGDNTLKGISVGGAGEPDAVFSGTPGEIAEFFILETRRRDPDVIEGHKLFDVILPELAAAAKKKKLPFAFGRSDNPAKFRTSRLVSAERTLSFKRCDVDGRDLVDTSHLALFCDVRNREFESVELDYLAGVFNFSGTPTDIVRELGNLWEPTYFYRAKVLPMSYQDIILRGTGSSLDLLFVSEYLKNNTAIPFPQEPRRYQGALSRAEKSGVFKNVRHCDVRSLYPSIISAWDLAPESDTIRVFPRLLREFLAFRIEAKERSRNAATPEERRNAGQLQEACKILINSFYGYLGFAQGSFNDFDLAEKVTAIGRDILSGMLDRLTAAGAEIIELDTDGIYFVAPENLSDSELEERVRSGLPDGITLEFDAKYPAMFSYKSKNYALLDQAGNVELTGSALRSRALEPFQRQYIASVCRELLNGTPENISGIYRKMYDSIADGTIELSQLAKSEVLSDSTANYKRKLDSGSGRRSAAYEAAISAGLALKAGETVRFYVTGERRKVTVADNCRIYTGVPEIRDENQAYYCAKLEELAENFRPFIDGTHNNDL